MSKSNLWRRITLPALALGCLVVAACDKKSAMGPAAGGPPMSRDSAARAPNMTPPMMEPKGVEKKEEAAPDPVAGKKAEPNTEAYDHFVDNPFLPIALAPRATFSADVNTASYSNVRRFLQTDAKLPPPDAVRIAELINYFEYDYPKPRGDAPVAFGLELAPCPWNAKHKLLRIAMAAKKYDPSEAPPRNLVFLIDTSGSMEQANKLPLAKEALGLLIDTLTDRDHVSIVTYAGSWETPLPATPGSQKDKIRNVVNGLRANGGTNGAGGLEAAYTQAQQNHIPGGINRILLLTDGDFNIGKTSAGDIVRMVEDKRKTGVFLTVLGFGMGNIQDARLEQLARHGNGHYAYIDGIEEAKKVFVDQGGALVTVAKDVKLQVEFNPKRVGAHRLIGYENRTLRDQDFNDDTKDAGDLGSGHTVTALFEIVPAGVKLDIPGVDPLKYQSAPMPTEVAATDEWATVKMRYKQPDGDESKLIEASLPGDGEAKNPSIDFRFAAAVTAWGMLLRDSPYKGTTTLDAVEKEVQASRGTDASARRAEFLRLVTLSKSLNR